MSDVKKLTHQEALEKAITGMELQRRQCVLNGVCQYSLETAFGTDHCAIGHILVGLIPEDNPAWNAKISVKRLINTLESVKDVLGHLDISFLLFLQNRHDSDPSLENWLASIHDLRKAAKSLDHLLDG